MLRERDFGIGRTLAYAGLLWLGIAAFAVPHALAGEPDETEGGKANLQQVASVAAPGHATHQAAAPSVRQDVEEPYFGNAPYICSPSGFGERAHCFLRASLQSHR